ncbi:MAG TPA: ferritin-like domain-containing protein [Alphaproteobacteria bacterium]|nr:ferritin-like domain-containing protein [Alphaproteobacteria bacterium]
MAHATIDAAGHRAGYWNGDVNGPVEIGSEAHKRLFCRMLLDTHDPYKPAVIDWPKLDEGARRRLVSLPIWNIAVQTEGKAKIRVLTYGELIRDPLLREAVDMNGFEEGRHKLVLSNMVEAYGIELDAEPPYPKPKDAEWAFMVTGYSECIDSFFAFGLFEVAKRSGYFPPELVDTFEPVMQEECRHILFYVNWVQWHRHNLPWWKRPLFDLRRALVYLYLARERLNTANDMGGDNFTMTGHESMGIELDLPSLIDLCLAENDRRMARYDARLKRPTFVPWVARFARRFMRTPKKATPTRAA